MLKPYDRYSPRANVPDSNYPLGSIKNESVPGADDGTPLEKDWGNNIEGFHQALLSEAGIVADGQVEKVGSSQLLAAVKTIGGGSVVSDLSKVTGSSMVGTEGLRLDKELFDVSFSRPKSATYFPTNKNPSFTVFLGDSNMVAEAVNYGNGYANKVVRSILNGQDKGLGQSRGPRFEQQLNMSCQCNLDAEFGISSTGSETQGGASNSRLQLLDGQKITITKREILYADIFYDASLTTGSIKFYLNGVLYKTIAAGGSGIKHTVNGVNPSGGAFYISESDSVDIVASGGTVIVTSIIAQREQSNSNQCIISAKSGWTFAEHSVPSRVAEVAGQVLSFNEMNSGVTVVICLGTNNMYNTIDKVLSPSAYIASLEVLVSAYKAALGNSVKFAIWTPPKSSYYSPVGFSYQDYISAISVYCDLNKHQNIRMDRCEVSNGGYYNSDGLHFDIYGHDLIAKFLCENLSVKFNISVPKKKISTPYVQPSVFSLQGSTTPGDPVYLFREANNNAGDWFYNTAGTISISSLGGATGDLTLIGVLGKPVLKTTMVSIFKNVGIVLPAGFTTVQALAIEGTKDVALYKWGSAGGLARLKDTDVTASFSIYFNATYPVQIG